MNRQTFNQVFSEIDDAYIIEAEKHREEKKMKNAVLAIIAAAAALVLIGGAVATTVLRSGETEKAGSIRLSDASYGVTVAEEEHPEEPMIPMVKLREMTEQELVDSSDLIIRGTVKNIQNIRLSAEGVDVVRALVTITPAAVLKGTAAGDVTLLASCPIDGSFQIEDTETACAIRTGMEGIFMLEAYGDTELWELENAALRWKDIADYHFGDGRRYAFLNTANGLLYADWAYPTLQAGSLDDVQAYLASFIR